MIRMLQVYRSLQIKQHVARITGIFLLIAPATLFAAGYQIPNQSLAAVGLAGAHIAYTPGPDAAFYNPANMNELEDRSQLEVSLTTLSLPSIHYGDKRNPTLNGSSRSELFFLPQLHLASAPYHNIRFGFSLTYPFGLAKRWQQPFPAATAEKFSLFVSEAAPVISYALSDSFSIAGGARIIYGKGEVVNDLNNPPFASLQPLTSLSRNAEGEAWAFGYSLAAAYRPTRHWRLAATYRSRVDLDIEGSSQLTARSGTYTPAAYDGPGNICIPLPAVLSLATSYTINDATLELAWNRTFWSALKSLDFNYNQSLFPALFNLFDRPNAKSWNDSDAVRLGLSYRFNAQYTGTIGFASDHTPVPASTLGFELPDADSSLFSFGLRYRYSADYIFGLSYLYVKTAARSIVNQGAPGIDGSFSGGGAHAITIGFLSSF